MAADDLSAPLGQDKAKRRMPIALGIPQVIVGVLSLFLLVFAGWATIADDPLGGEPMAVAPADLQAEAKKPEEAAPRPAAPPASGESPEAPRRYDGPAPVEAVAPALPPGSRTVTIIDGTSGRRQDVVVPGTGGAVPAGVAPAVPPPPMEAPDSRLAALDERISEPSRHGFLPKVAPDGARPAEVFAKAVRPIPGKPNAPRVAIVVGGLGVGTGATNDAIRKLPGPVTLAFGAYGGDLVRQVARARDAGHEVLLQVPMEPFDYPDNDPGPQALLTSLDQGQNVDRLQWLMSRFQGYVGLVNLMGARLTASEQALAPILRETARRGLIYVDDGSSPRSLASQIAGANNLAFAKADATIDAVPTAGEIDRALGRLEAIARERGIAVGMAQALPVSIERLARWAKAAEARGVLVVPISAAVVRAKSS